MPLSRPADQQALHRGRLFKLVLIPSLWAADTACWPDRVPDRVDRQMIGMTIRNQMFAAAIDGPLPNRVNMSANR